MKRIITLLSAIFLSLAVTAQTVENIRVDQDGENVLVHYRIGGSTDAQIFKVSLSCSIDGGRRFEPITVIGDVGENIRGGKSNYTVTWDVFEDLDEIGNVEFFVTVDLISDLGKNTPVKETQMAKDPVGLHYILAYTGSTLAPYGISTGFTFNKWGAYLSYRYGNSEFGSSYMDWGVFVAGIMRQIVEKEKYRLYVFAGAGAVSEYSETDGIENYSGTYMMGEVGILNTFGRVSLTLGMEYTDWINPVFGIGYMFPIIRKAK